MGERASQITSLAIVNSTVYSAAAHRKHQSSASLAFVRGSHRRPVNSSHKFLANDSLVYWGRYTSPILDELRKHKLWYTAPLFYAINMFVTALTSYNLKSDVIYCKWKLAGPHYGDVIKTTMASQITSYTLVDSTVYSDADQRKHQSSASLAFMWGLHRDRWIPCTKGQVRGKCFHLVTSSCQTMLFNLYGSAVNYFLWDAWRVKVLR